MESAHKPKFYKTSDFLLYAIFLVSICLEYIFPTGLYISRIFLFISGFLVLCFAWSIIIAAKIQFKKYNQESGPGGKITKVISKGIFSYSRNPIYVGVVMLLFGLGLILNSLWIIIFTPILMYILLVVLIRPEEIYLKKVFNVQYTEYCKKVKRWI